MFGGAKLLGKKNIWIGDTKQLPPVVALSDDKVNRKKEIKPSRFAKMFGKKTA